MPPTSGRIMTSTKPNGSLRQEVSKDSFKTPNTKGPVTAWKGSCEVPQMPIMMDEYGQTPDHFYLARNPAKPPAQRNQVKRRLDMESPELDHLLFKAPPVKKGRPPCSSPAKIMNTTARVRHERNRYDTSLGLLTKKFVSLLRGAPDGVVDLNKASESLGVQKRRIYDITNVLEGVGLIEKKSKNNIKWREGRGNAFAKEQQTLQTELSQLESKENLLDELISKATVDLNVLTENQDKKLAYVTYRDLRSISSLEDQTVIAVNAPPETRLEVPDPRKNLQIWLKSEKGEIDVYLSNPGDSPAEEPSHVGSSEEPCSSSSSSDNYRGDPALKHALISEDDDLAPMGKNFLLETEDQNDSFVHLEPPLSEEDYNFTLDEAEGIADLFDDYDLCFSEMCAK